MHMGRGIISIRSKKSGGNHSVIDWKMHEFAMYESNKSKKLPGSLPPMHLDFLTVKVRDFKSLCSLFSSRPARHLF